MIDRLAEMPHLTVEQLPAVDHNLWAFAVQQSVHEALDRALDRALAGSLVPTVGH